MPYITKEDIEIPRTASCIREWVDFKIKAIGKIDGGKNAVTFRKGLTKELIEEAMPLAIFCNHYFNNSRCVIVQHCIGNQNYDAKIRDKRLRKTPLKYIEITQAHEGENSYLRMLHLKSKGFVNNLGSVTKKGTKKTGITVEVDSDAVEHSIVVHNELQRIHDAALKKSKKEYLPNTGLVIICDDFIAFSKQEDIDMLKNYMYENILGHLLNFRMVFIIGWMSGIYLKFDQNERNRISQCVQN